MYRYDDALGQLLDFGVITDVFEHQHVIGCATDTYICSMNVQELPPRFESMQTTSPYTCLRYAFQTLIVIVTERVGVRVGVTVFTDLFPDLPLNVVYP